MIIDLNILKRMDKRFGVWPLSKLDPKIQYLITNPQHFIKAPAGFEPLITGGGYEWDDELNGYRLGDGQKMYLLPNGIAIWVFKDAVARALPPDSIQKWVSADEEYPMGKANAFFQIYGHLTSQDLGQNETAGDNVGDGEQDADADGGVATADDENGPEFSKADVQKMLAGDYSAAGVAGPKASMSSAIPTGKEDEPEPQNPEASFAPPKGGGPPPSRAKAGQPLPPDVKSKAEAAKIQQLIKKLTLGSPTYPADQIIDFWKKAKDLEATQPELAAKLMAAVKQLKPLEEGKIAKSMLETLVRGVVRGIVNEVKEAKKKAKKKKSSPKPESTPDTFPDEEPAKEPHSQMDWEPSAEQPQRPEKRDDGKWLVALANKLWKDPLEIGHGQYSWRVRKTVEHPEGPVYLLQKSKQVTDTRVFANRHGKWFWFNPDERPIENRKWHELDMVHPSDEPSIEEDGGGAAAGPGGMSTTSNAQAVTGPNAFKKKNSMEEGDEADAAREAELDALWNRALDRLMKGPPKAKKEKKPTKDRSGKIFVKGKETKLDEMTTTSGGGGTSQGTTGYSVPGAWCGPKGEGGSKAGVKGSEKLGYTLTAIGKKEMEKHGDKMLQEGVEIETHGKCYKCKKPFTATGAFKCRNCGAVQPQTSEKPKPVAKPLNFPLEASGLGANFDRAQRAYDNQTPPEPDGLQCPECGEEGGYYTERQKKGRFYMWSAECPDCGNTWGDDNLDDVDQQ